VIAHEVGHHVQNLLGVSGKVQSMKRQASEAQANALSVRLELQAQGYVVPESFTHGASEQRRKWFNAGYTSGSMKACDTFSAKLL